MQALPPNEAAAARRPAIDVYARLRRSIILGEFAPGVQLKEQALAAQMQVSRSPIRVAFRRLEEDGLVSSEPNRGVFVATWADQDSDEVFDLRAVVESHAAGLAARRRQPEHLRRLHQLNETMAHLIVARPEDFLHRLQQVNAEFHQVVLQAAASPRLTQFVASLMAVHRVIGAFYYYTDQQLADSLADHRQLLRAIERRDPALARAVLEGHIRGTAERLKVQRQDLRPVNFSQTNENHSHPVPE
ncbi:FCD domain-containing protein [Xylophilus rhododendri]|uniref:FCD domain-containing protein n=1 Tax=Xylophilus rhododendri TaxID=2697032 RepID=A0A857J175_9BURK|nr:GntR family transcriptional regulator [Xylophilus rhododendri]QHI96718.1 FCD domain-containing protein [Xylophilus rhododendri]